MHDKVVPCWRVNFGFPSEKLLGNPSDCLMNTKGLQYKPNAKDSTEKCGKKDK